MSETFYCVPTSLVCFNKSGTTSNFFFGQCISYSNAVYIIIHNKEYEFCGSKYDNIITELRLHIVLCVLALT